MAEWFVYVITFGDEMQKIGVSIDPDRRLRTLCSHNTIGSAPTSVAYVLPVSRERVRAIEKRAHRILSDRRYRGSECFYCHVEVAIAAVDMAVLMERKVPPKSELLDPASPARNRMRRRHDSRGRPACHSTSGILLRSRCAKS